MKVKELIKSLQAMPNHDAHVFHLYDGDLYGELSMVYESRGGKVVTSDYSQVCYETDSRPKDAPTSTEDPHWRTPDHPDSRCSKCGNYMDRFYQEDSVSGYECLECDDSIAI